MKLTSKKWKQFRIGSIFKVSRGQRFITAHHKAGNIPYCSASDKNNGVTDFISNPLFIEENALIYSTFGDCYYMEGKFTASDEISILKNKSLNTYNGKFIATILSANKYKYQFVRKAFQNKFIDEYIYLPVNDKDDPDWEWMEQYMKSLEKGLDEQMKSIMEVANGDKNTIKIFANKVDINDFTSWLNTNADMSKNQMSLNSIKWKEFCLGTLFNTPYKGFAYTKTQIENNISNGSLPVFYVTRTENNNAVSNIINVSEDLKGIEQGNAIVIGDTTATVSYQKDKFICGDHIVILRADWLNYYTGLFIKAIIEYDKYKYSYGRAFNIEYIINSNVYLPTSDNINPDWNWIEQYMKSLPYSDR